MISTTKVTLVANQIITLDGIGEININEIAALILNTRGEILGLVQDEVVLEKMEREIQGMKEREEGNGVVDRGIGEGV